MSTKSGMFSLMRSKKTTNKTRPSKGVESLKSWTGKANATIVYDSTVDQFTADGLFDKVKGKRNVAVIGFTTDCDVFGGFYSVAVTEQNRCFFDPNIFAFSFESHGRCETPKRFVVKEDKKDKAFVLFYKNNSRNRFVLFGVINADVCGFYLGNEKSDSFCCDLSRGFEGIEDTTLTGQNLEDDDYGPYHHCTRLVAIQLE